MPARRRTFYSVRLVLAQTTPFDVTIDKHSESPGLHYDDTGSAQVYSTEWKLVTYVDFEEANQNLETVRKYARLSITFCKGHEHALWVNLINCVETIGRLDGQIKERNNLKSFVTELTRIDYDGTVTF
jgi:hypothetical protein